MVLRIVSGDLVISGGNGFVTIKLKSNSIVDGTGNATICGCEFGGSTDYDSEPCSALSIKAFTGNPDSINIDGPTFFGPVNGTDYENVRISWNRSGVGAELTKISYFFAGEE